MLRQIVHTINVALRLKIQWPVGDTVAILEGEFRNLCGLLGVLGAIDGTHFSISKPCFALADYFYFKSREYTITC